MTKKEALIKAISFIDKGFNKFDLSEEELESYLEKIKNPKPKKKRGRPKKK